MEAHKQQEAFLSNTTDSNKAEDVESIYTPENESNTDTSDADGQ